MPLISLPSKLCRRVAAKVFPNYETIRYIYRRQHELQGPLPAQHWSYYKSSFAFLAALYLGNWIAIAVDVQAMMAKGKTKEKRKERKKKKRKRRKKKSRREWTFPLPHVLFLTFPSAPKCLLSRGEGLFILFIYYLLFILIFMFLKESKLHHSSCEIFDILKFRYFNAHKEQWRKSPLVYCS